MPLPRPLRIRDFRNLWIGQTVSQFGDAVYGLLFIFMADRLTRDPAFVGLVAALTALPFLIVGPIAGVVADRHDRRRVMLAADLFSALVLGAFWFELHLDGTPSRVLLLAAPFLLSSVNAFFLPAKGAAVPRLVPADVLMEANGVSQATASVMAALGLMVAALVLGPLEALDPRGFFSLAVLVNMGTFLVSAWFVSQLPPIVPDGLAAAQGTTRDELQEGARIVVKHPVLAPLFAANVLVNLCISGFMVVYTASNRAWFGGSFMRLAFIELCFLGAMVVSSLAVSKGRVKRVGVSYAFGTAFVGLTVLLMGVMRSYAGFLVWNALAGLALPFSFLPVSTYMALAVEDRYRGRVQSFAAMVSAGIQPLGAGLTGLGLDRIGLVGMYILMGAGMGGAGVLPLLKREFRASELPSVPD